MAKKDDKIVNREFVKGSHIDVAGDYINEATINQYFLDKETLEKKFLINKNDSDDVKNRKQGLNQLSNHEYSNAMKSFEDIENKAGEDWYHLGVTYCKLQEDEKSEECFEKAENFGTSLSSLDYRVLLERSKDDDEFEAMISGYKEKARDENLDNNERFSYAVKAEIHRNGGGKAERIGLALFTSAVDSKYELVRMATERLKKIDSLSKRELLPLQHSIITLIDRYKIIDSFRKPIGNRISYLIDTYVSYLDEDLESLNSWMRAAIWYSEIEKKKKTEDTMLIVDKIHNENNLKLPE